MLYIIVVSIWYVILIYPFFHMSISWTSRMQWLPSTTMDDETAGGSPPQKPLSGPSLPPTSRHHPKSSQVTKVGSSVVTDTAFQVPVSRRCYQDHVSIEKATNVLLEPQGFIPLKKDLWIGFKYSTQWSSFISNICLTCLEVLANWPRTRRIQNIPIPEKTAACDTSRILVHSTYSQSTINHY